MSNNVGVNVTATMNTAAITAAVNQVQQTVAQANRTQLNPVSPQAVNNAKALFEQLKKIRPELNRRLNATGQGGLAFEQVDLGLAGYSQHHINRIQQYVLGTSGANAGRGNGGTRGGGFGQMAAGVAAGVAQAGLRAAGPAGGVAAGAIGTGMAAGAGAGLMGLMGGMLALGVGKLVSGVMEKVEQAENNAIAYDRLKRVLGDVSVSFGGLKSIVEGSAKNLSITFDEAARLSTQFAKLGNLSGDKYKSIPDEMKNAVGLSRAFGLDPSQGVGVMGQLRGVGATKDVQDSRRFALLIGETIGRSGAFAKADEVMEALASYTTQQTRSGLGGANQNAYGGLFSALVGSGIPGLDPAGAASLMSRVNSSLASGGAKGEASQFFTGQIGAGMGLDPIQTQIMREGGAFATNDNSFGNGSVYSRFMGGAGPKGSQTYLDATLGRLRGQYGSNPLMLAQATSNHLGIGLRQAMGLLSVNPNQMGEMGRYAGDLTKLSGTGIGNLSTALYGSASDRQSLAGDYLGRTGADALSATDRAALEGASGNDEKLRDVLGRIAGKYDQERTQGSDIRDSKNALDNIKTSMADKLVPLTQEIRHGIMYIAGNGGKSPMEIQQKVLELESKDRVSRIEGDYDPKLQALRGKRAGLSTQIEQLSETRLTGSAIYLGKPELVEQKRKERIELEQQMLQTDAEIQKLSQKKADLLKKETDLLTSGIDALKTSATTTGASPGGMTTGDFSRFDRKHSGGSASLDTSSVDALLAEAERKNGMPKGMMKSIMQQEIGGNRSFLDDPSKYHYGLDANGRRIAPHTGKISTAFGPFGILESTARDPGYGVSPLQNKSIEEQIRFTGEYAAARARAAGSWEGGLAGYGEGSGYASSVMSRVGTPTPHTGKGGDGWGREVRFTIDPLHIAFQNPPREMILPSTFLQPRVAPANPVLGGAR